MPVTIDVPLHILERAKAYASAEGISVEEYIARLLEEHTISLPQKSDTRFGLFRGAVTYIAEDFDETPDDFKEYVE